MARIVKKIKNWRDDPRAGNHWERKLIKGGDQIPVHELSWLRTDKVAGKLPAELGGDTPGDDDDTESDKDKQVKAQNAVNIIVSAFWTQGFLQQLITTGERYAVRITANKLAELEKAQGKDATGAPAPEYTTSALDIFTAIFERDLARTEAVRHEEQEAAQQKAARDKISQGAPRSSSGESTSGRCLNGTIWRRRGKRVAMQRPRRLRSGRRRLARTARRAPLRQRSSGPR